MLFAFCSAWKICVITYTFLKQLWAQNYFYSTNVEILTQIKFTFLDGKSTIAAMTVLITLAGLSLDSRRILAGLLPDSWRTLARLSPDSR